jgi:excisionase family DNA binding protein
METKTSVERLICPKELAEILCLKRSCIHRLLRSGAIPSIAVAAGARKLSLRVRPSALERWMKQRELVQR